MTFAILGGGQLDTGYTIDNSLIFNDGDSPYLSRTPSTPTNRKIWTYSTWVKRSTLGASKVILAHNKVGNPNSILRFNSTDDTIRFFDVNSSSITVIDLITTQVFRDVSAFYHIILSVDTTQATSSDRVKLYINGNQVTSFSTETYPSQNYDTTINSTEDVLEIGASNGSTNFDGYMAETYFIDGQQLDASSFGEFDEDSGIWKPIEYTGTYGTNGFYLDFENSGSLGADQSGNGNNFTPNNLTSADQATDTPTNNFATLNPLDSTSATLSEGNLKALVGTTLPRSTNSTISVSQGKWYFEVKITAVGFGNFGVLNANYNGRYYDASTNPTPYAYTDNAFYAYTGSIRVDGSIVSTVASFTTGDIMGVALNIDDDEITFYKNGSSQGTFSKTFSGNYKIGFSHGGGSGSTTYELNTGNPSFSISSGNSDQNGYGNFEYAPPSGFLALCTQNLATELSPTIDDGSQYFNTVLYTGNGTNPRSLTGVGFQPDFTWIKNRTDAWGHGLADSTRGGGKTLITNSTAVEQTNYTWGYVDSFDSDGFTVDAGASGDDFVNQTSDNYVSWNWLAGGGSVSNSDGTISSQVNFNQTAGFSIVTYSGNQTDGATVGHGLGIAPQVVIIKERNGTSSWIVKHPGLTDAGYYLILEADSAESTAANVWSDTDPSSTVFTLGDSTAVNENTLNYVAYCFAEIEGYSKFGSYIGNGSTDGPFVYTEFRPAFVLWKRKDGATDWRILDTTRDSYNVANKRLFPNTNGAENTAQNTIDFLSNGFKHRATNAGGNFSGGNYIYMAFAENPFATSTGVPVVAR